MQRPLSTAEVAAIGGYLPEDMDADEIAALLRLFEGGGSGGGRKTGGATSDEPEWWGFYVERVVRAAWGKAAVMVRLALGLTQPLAANDAADFVRELIRAEALPERGAHGYIYALGKDDGELFTVWTGDDYLTGAIADLAAEDILAAGAGRSAAYTALMYLARGASEDARLRFGACGADMVAFMLSDTIPDWPWMGWSPALGNYYADNLTLHIGSIVATPDQVLALYDEARRAVVEHWGAEGRPVPIALSAERMRLVRFVEQEAGGGPYDWTALLEAWTQAGGDYATPAAMKAAFYQSSMPVKRYRAKTRKEA